MLDHEVVIVGGGAAGIATAASLLRRRPALDVAIIEPRDTHYHQPGFTLVGAGVLSHSQVQKPMTKFMPGGATRLRTAVQAFRPDSNAVVLEDGGELMLEGREWLASPRQRHPVHG